MQAVQLKEKYPNINKFQLGFSQPTPGFGLEDDNGWHRIARPLSLHFLNRHLIKEVSIGTYGRWYPYFGVLDFDDVPLARVYEVCSAIGFLADQFTVFTSRSANSWHVYFKPTKDGKQITLSLYGRVMMGIGERFKIEIYPQAKHVIRLPFGRDQHLVYNGVISEVDYHLGMELLFDMDEFEVGNLPFFSDNSIIPHIAPSLRHAHEEAAFPSFIQPIEYAFGNKGWRAEGLEYFNAGLELSHSRVYATKRVSYFLWSQNIPLETSMEMAQEWLETKHHGFSKDFLSNPKKALKQTDAITQWTYDHMECHYRLPDSAHLMDKGFMSAEQARQIVVASRGRLPLLKFGLNLFSYLAPRTSANGNNKIAVHSNRLLEWASIHNYLDYIKEYQTAGLLKRDARYKVGVYAKGITVLNGKNSLDNYLKEEGDVPSEGVHQVIPKVYTPMDYSQQLKALGVERSAIRKQINEIYPEESKPTVIRTKKASTEELVLNYRKNHPNAKHQEVADALNLGLRTVKRYQAKVPFC